ncbi:hypothetical protein THRCLA_22992 [Thraustotheca clavata]|uniref:Uncharacterized protein n=1 Tax=Thraustotheca clavata TaxID=74557 RepID=A0A1V9YJR1_9STRA|nr:hypothetical protein THRCLA_22992 [Thraustotheca clavata]
MKVCQLPLSLQLRTRKYYRFFLHHKTVYKEARIFEDLRTNLKHDITEHYARVTVRNIAFFQGFGFVSDVAMRLKPTFFSPQSTVIKVLDLWITASEMYIISKGIDIFGCLSLGVLHVSFYDKTTKQEFGMAGITLVKWFYYYHNTIVMALLTCAAKYIASCTVMPLSTLFWVYCLKSLGLEYHHLEIVLSRYPTVMENCCKLRFHVRYYL